MYIGLTGEIGLDCPKPTGCGIMHALPCASSLRARVQHIISDPCLLRHEMESWKWFTGVDGRVKNLIITYALLYYVKLSRQISLQ